MKLEEALALITAPTPSQKWLLKTSEHLARIREQKKEQQNDK